MTLRKLTALAPAAALGACLFLAGCGSAMNEHDMGSMSSPTAAGASASSGSATPAAGPHNDADLAFATMMVPHHNQAIEMSELVLAKSDADPKVTALAQRIKAAQGPEVAQLTSWLTGWGAEPSMGGMDHGGHDGMMSQADLDTLQKATGDQATQLFLNGMIKHHTGAITMAQTELSDGENPAAKKLAQAIIDAQQAEITEMQQLSGR